MEEILPTQPIQSPQPPIPPKVPEKKSNGGLIVKLLIVTLLISGGAFYAGMRLSGKPVALPFLKLTPTIVPQPTVIPTPDETANWKTYKNDKYELSFKYPSDWKTRQKPSENYNNPNKASGFKDECLNNYMESYLIRDEVDTKWGALSSFFEFSVSVTNPDEWDLEKWIEVCRGEYESKWSYNRKILKIGGKNVILLVYDGNPGNGGLATVYSYFWENNKKFYNFTFNNHIFVQDQESVPEKLLETLNFLDSKQTDETANWKTYTDSKYGFSFRYPETETLKATNYTGYLSTVSLMNPKTQIEDLVFYVGTRDESEGYKNDANYKVSKTTLAGFDATRVSLPMGQNPPQELIFFTNAGNYYKIQFIWDGKDTEIFTFFDQILSTFKFLD